MKYRFEIETESLAELRAELLSFLGINELQTTTFINPPTTTELLKNFVEEQAPDISTSVTGSASQVEITKKRRTKAEIEAAKLNAAPEGGTTDAAPEPAAAEQEENQAPASSETPAPPAEQAPTPSTSTITKEFLTPIVLQKGREGKRGQTMQLFANYKTEAGAVVERLPDLQEKDYEDFHSKLISI